MGVFKRKLNSLLVTFYINESVCRVHCFDITCDPVELKHGALIEYSSISDLQQKIMAFVNQNHLQKNPCRWILANDLYQTHNIDKPDVNDDEVMDALKWQVKDLIDIPVDSCLVSYYQPAHPENKNKQIVAVTVSKDLIEQLIDICDKTSLLLENIDIEELVIGHALLPYFNDQKIIGFVGENDQGLVFNFYYNNELAFVRHKKDFFIPQERVEEFVLEQEQEELSERFLLETQRTLDYVVSQLFRRPIELLLLQANEENADKLLNLIKQLTDVPCQSVIPEYINNNSHSIAGFYELGCICRGGK
ncbi:MAG: hypothetical protein OEY19_02635 [Gammaproteobacteria bacterium]|nr:hypothetical protein [Gammaproteobacteria bacterium]MDH5628952.1 hypothetical protein [Gammaproteobacteria bacterium]